MSQDKCDVIRAGFQFHEGPIKTLNRLALPIHTAVFQFHEGPIKT